MTWACLSLVGRFQFGINGWLSVWHDALHRVGAEMVLTRTSLTLGWLNIIATQDKARIVLESDRSDNIVY